MSVFFTADHHFGHARIIELAKRPYRNLDQMHGDLIARWNAVVQPDDTVWHLGDFSYRRRPEEAISILDRLNGRKHLVVGNHDRREIREGPWEAVWTIADVRIEGQRIICCHYPMLEWPGFFHGALHVFGHVHGNRQGVEGSTDVGVDVWDYRPASFSEVVERIGDRA